MTKPVKISAMLFFILIISTLSGCVQQTNNEKQNEHPYTPQQPALETLDNYDWDRGLPSWDVLNNTASNFTRITGIVFMKSAVPTGLFVDDPSMPINESLIEENLAVKDRLHANVYEVRLSFIYKDGGFYPPGPENVKTNVFLRSIMTDGVLAKKTGLADKRVLEAIESASEYGMASMCMLGNSVFAMGKTKELSRVLSTFGKTFVSSVDEFGARVIEK